MKGIAKWLEVSEKYGTAVGLLTSNWFNERAYNEDKFARVFTAVEGLLSRKKARNKASMNSVELAEFVEQMVPGFSDLTNYPADDWAERVKEIRNQRVSHSDPVSTVATDGRTIILMTNLLYVAGASFLPREIGIEEQQIEEYIHVCYQSLLLSDQQQGQRPQDNRGDAFDTPLKPPEISRRYLPLLPPEARRPPPEHPDRRQAGWKEMANLSTHAAKSHEFHPNSLRVSLAEIARWSYGDASTVARALDEG